ncbi:MAG: hypothetical protein R8N23_03580 [Reichenbachiella sp.]|uniref:hypothetical protein n=1 Tax=Reichenbachiella sp. TaxID=2184521 RepID=UPI002967562C|nr:hypothetical protein [Reichenbachiella sp.]MDW3208919.1 hypothetical protein [Reichenbachiella sp.]
MKNLYKRDVAEYGILEIQSVTPFFTLGKNNTDARFQMAENFINAQINSINRELQLKRHGHVGPYETILQYPLMITLFKKDSIQVVETANITLPRGRYSRFSLYKILTDHISFYFEDLEFDIQIAIGSASAYQVNSDIVTNEVVRLISQSNKMESTKDLLLKKALKLVGDIEKLFGDHDVIAIRIYSLKDNLSWSGLLSLSLIHRTEINVLKDSLNSIFRDFYRRLCEDGYTDNKFELVISVASIPESIDRRLKERLIPLSKYTSLVHLLDKEEVRKIGDAKFTSLPKQVLSLLDKQPAFSFPLFVFETINKVQFLRSWCIQIEKSFELSAYNHLFAKIFESCKDSNTQLLFAVPKEIEELGYLLELAQHKELGNEKGIQSLSNILLPFDLQDGVNLAKLANNKKSI